MEAVENRFRKYTKPLETRGFREHLRDQVSNTPLQVVLFALHLVLFHKDVEHVVELVNQRSSSSPAPHSSRQIRTRYEKLLGSTPLWEEPLRYDSQDQGTERVPRPSMGCSCTCCGYV